MRIWEWLPCLFAWKRTQIFIPLGKNSRWDFEPEQKLYGIEAHVEGMYPIQFELCTLDNWAQQPTSRVCTAINGKNGGFIRRLVDWKTTRWVSRIKYSLVKGINRLTRKKAADLIESWWWNGHRWYQALGGKCTYCRVKQAGTAEQATSKRERKRKYIRSNKLSVVQRMYVLIYREGFPVQSLVTSVLVYVSYGQIRTVPRSR